MKYINLTFLAFAIIAAFTFSSCVDNDFDRPEATLGISEELVVSVETVLEALGTSNTTFTDSIYVKGVVTADDESGNFYKLLTFQDETGALSVSVDQNELNAAYPEGNTVYVYLKGLTIARDAGTPKLGFGVIDGRLERIPDGLVSKFLVPGGPATEVEPTLITIDEFASDPDKFLNKLIKLENVEFSLGEVGQTYATAEGTNGDPVTENRTILNCDGDNIILRNSGYATFVNEVIPKENGTLIAIASKFNDDLQLFIRDTDDVIFTGERCDGSGGGQTGDEITIGSIKESFYASGADKVQEGFITGVVISDKNAGQVDGQNIIIQNGEHGIVVRFTGDHNYDLGDMLQITVSGIELSEYRGVLQINNVPLFNVIDLGTGALPDPKELTVSEFLSDNNRYESMRLLIKNAMLTSTGGTFSGNVDLEDNTGTCILRTATFANFANEPVPSGIVEVVCIGSQYTEGAVDEIQVMINDPSDVSGGTVTPVETLLLSDFQNETTDADVNIAGWMNIAVEGAKKWVVKEFDGAKYAECEAYQAASPNTLVWLITPTVDTDEYQFLNFDSQMAYWQHQGLTVWVSSDFSDVANADWKQVTDVALPNADTEFFTDVNSGDIDLTDYATGSVRIGFKYEGTSGANTTKVRIDNVTVLNK